jgi:hypothetical protein
VAHEPIARPALEDLRLPLIVFDPEKDLIVFTIPPMPAHSLDHRYGHRLMLAGFVAIALRQTLPRAFQMAVAQTQAHFAALGDTRRFGQVAPVT